MARILLGWEIGANRGHFLRLEAIAKQLRVQGHSIAWAVSRVGQLNEVAQPGEPVFQAPLWPGQQGAAQGKHLPRVHRSYADTLAGLGLSSSGSWGQQLRAWDTILSATEPDAVFADFAPALLSTARGRVKSVASGIGFAVPPSHLAHFPLFEDCAGQPVGDPCGEAILLEEVNRGLAGIGQLSLANLPGLFSADHLLVAAFRELDPYHAHRTDRHVAPFLMNWSPPVTNALGTEAIAYFSPEMANEEALFAALGWLDMPITVVLPGASERQQGHMRITGQPLPFADIARRARIVISNGNTGFVSAAMLAGLPQAIIHHDWQKQLVGEAVAGLRVGLSGPLKGCDWNQWSASLTDLAADESIRARARALASRTIPRMATDPVTTAVSYLTALATCATPILMEQIR